MQKLPLFFLVILLLPIMAMADDTLCKVGANSTTAVCDTGSKVTVNPFIQFGVWAQNNVGMAVFLGLFGVAVAIIVTHWLRQKKNQMFERVFIILMIILVLVMLYYLFWG